MGPTGSPHRILPACNTSRAYIPKAVFLWSFRKTHTTSLCFPPQHTQRLQTQQSGKNWRNLKSFGLVTHLTTAISTSQPQTGTDDGDTKREPREMPLLSSCPSNQPSPQLHRPDNDFARGTGWWLLPPDSKLNILITTNWAQVGSVLLLSDWPTPSKGKHSMEKGLERISKLEFKSDSTGCFSSRGNILPAKGESSKGYLCYELCLQAGICGSALLRQEYKHLTKISDFLFFAW